ncbi:MAG TPA: hypothetical protein VFW38_12505 [Solirubrobacteraceae bacterium]|nr:hypothetical protein [Solirubrobacteraceae bacterium]
MLGLVWVVALHGHAPGRHESTGTVPTPAPSAKAQEKAAAAPTQIYKGAAPGVEGLTRAIAKAHGAVALSQRNAHELRLHSREASQEPSTSSSTASHRAAAQSAAATRARKTTAHVRQAPAHTAHRPAAAKRASDHRPAAQVVVEREVAQGKTVLLLFWDSKSSVDREVHSETQAMVASSKGKLALHAAAPRQVGEFGSLTEVAQVYQTPTILIVNRHGVVSTLTGLTDTFSLRQLVHEAQRAK